MGAVSAEEAAPIAVREERREGEAQKAQKGNYRIFYLFITPRLFPPAFPLHTFPI